MKIINFVNKICIHNSGNLSFFCLHRDTLKRQNAAAECVEICRRKPKLLIFAIKPL
jgi:hypothetical protein